jgi:rhomboid protease GluP
MTIQPGEPGAMGDGEGFASPGARDGRGRIAPADLVAFRRDLDAATRGAIVTPMIVLACGAHFAAMVAAGVPILWPSAAELVRWGANDGARLVLRHEYGRLIASVFVHGGLIHLTVNMWSLLVIGPLVERIYGNLAFAVVYLAAGIGGAIASAAVPPLRVSVGASGAICGVLGALLAFLVVHRRDVPPTVLRRLRRDVLGIVLLMAALGAVVTNIDQAAHLGGLATGFGCGLLLIGPWPVTSAARRRLVPRRIALTAAIAAGLAVAASAVARRGEATIAPVRRLDDLTDQIAPIVRDYQAIRAELSRPTGQDEAGRDPPVLPALRARAVASAARLERVRTDPPELRALRDALARALARQIARIDALATYRRTGDPAALDAAREAMASSLEAIRECEEHRRRFLARHGLIPTRPSGRLDP